MCYQVGTVKVEYEIQENGCWNCVNRKTNNGGYPSITYLGVPYSVHRFIYKNFVLDGDNFEEGDVVMHTCDNRLCVNLNHLKLGTQKLNLLDMGKKRRQRSCRHKIDAKQADLIRDIFNSGIKTKSELMEIFDLSISNLNRILNNKIWTR